MVELKNAMDLLGKDAEDVQVIMISVDPERDTPDKIATYATHFHPSFLGVTGSLEEVSRLATLYGIYFAKSEGSDLTGYLIDHTATVIVVNQEGNVKLLFPYGTTGEEFAADLEYLIHH
jgi:protein SCO1/2